MKFKTLLIGDIASVQTGPFGSQLHQKDYVQDGTPIVTVEHLGKRKMTRQNLPCVSDSDRKRLSKYTLEHGDLVFSRVGSVDRCSLVSAEEDGWLFSGRCLRVRANNKDELNSKFLFYFFNQKSIKDYVRSIAVGATMPSINTRLLSEVPISLPSIAAQYEIADVLSTLDDKIELNEMINNHLTHVLRTDISPDIRRGRRLFRTAARCADSSLFACICRKMGRTVSSKLTRLASLGNTISNAFSTAVVMLGTADPTFMPAKSRRRTVKYTNFATFG